MKAFLRNRSGGALITAMILAMAVGIVVAHVLSTTVTESRLTEHVITRLEADNTAEMLVDYGLSEIAARFDADSSFSTDEFSPSGAPLALREELLESLGSGRIHADSLFLAGGPLSLPVRYHVNRDDPANTYDPHKGMNVYVRTANLYGRASVIHPHIGLMTSYARLTVQIRDAPLFAYAVFYNMDLEFHPGPAMSMEGTVHSNGTIWLACVNSLEFSGVLTAAEDIRIGLKGSPLSWASSQKGNRITFRNAGGDWQTLYKTGATNELSSYYTSVSPDSAFSDLGYENWREYASNEFGGNLQSADHGVSPCQPSGVRQYVPDEDGLTEKQNHAYSLIEPNLPTSSPYHKGDAERQKFARRAGIVIRVHRDELDNATGLPNSDPTDPHYPGDGIDDDRGAELPGVAVRLRSRPEIDNGWSSAARARLNYFSSLGEDEEPDAASTPDTPRDFNTGYYLSFAMLKRSDQADPMSALQLTKEVVTYFDESGESVEKEIDQVAEVPLHPHDEFDYEQNDTVETAFGDELRAKFDEIFAAHPYRNESEAGVDYNGDGDTNDFVSGMIDNRIAQADSSTNGNSRLDLIEVNLAALADVVETSDHALFSTATPEEFFNGVVYVEFPTDSDVTPRTKDKIIRAPEKLALILTQAGGSDPDIGRVPNPDYNKADGREEGFTLATNAPLYTRGHFNADGLMNTPASGSAMGPDDPDDPSPPVALAADAVTVLSPNWSFSSSTSNRPNASSTEVCTAILTGILPTNEGGRSVISGGNHNFIRFLENWSGDRLRFRGSMACAFESEIQADPLSTAYYSPPNREWGYFTRFAAGDFPPGTPTYASYRKSGFEFLSAAEFAAAIEALPWEVTLPDLPE